MKKILTSVFLYPAVLLTGLYDAIKQKELGIILICIPFLLIPVIGQLYNYYIAFIVTLISFPICFFIGAKLSK